MRNTATTINQRRRWAAVVMTGGLLLLGAACGSTDPDDRGVSDVVGSDAGQVRDAAVQRIAEPFPDLGALAGRALVVPQDRRAEGGALRPEGNRAMHLPGQPDRIGRRDAVQKRPTGHEQGPPPGIRVLFGPSCRGRLQRIGFPDGADDPPELIDEHRLQTRRPEVEPDRVQQWRPPRWPSTF